MADYGVTINGFVKKPFDVILDEMKTGLKGALGDVNTSDDAVFGIIAGVMAKPQADAWDVMEADYYAMYPNYANGTPLDNACEYNAIRRLDAQPSNVIISCNGTEGIDILAGSIFAALVSNFNYVSQYPIVISIDNTNYFTIEITTVTDDTDYIVTINGRNAVINSGTSAAKTSISTALFNEINLLTETLTVNADLIDAGNGIIDIWANDQVTPVIAEVSTEITVLDFWSPVRCQSQEVGAQVIANAETITQIVTPVAGLDAVTNYLDAVAGRDRENDVELRERRYESVRIVGGGTLSSVIARVRQNVLNVTQATGFENDSSITDPSGRPPHSIEIFVVGGADVDIANEILVAKADGIQAYGNTIINVEDSQGTEYAIGFSRPVNAYIWVRLTLTVTSDFPVNGAQQIIDNILEFAETLQISDDVLIQSLYCPIYNVEGVTDAVIELAKTPNPGDTPSYVTTNITIADEEIAIFDSTRIEVNIP